eukprot:768373-Hanusia_phi.AAC.6
MAGDLVLVIHLPHLLLVDLELIPHVLLAHDELLVVCVADGHPHGVPEAALLPAQVAGSRDGPAVLADHVADVVHIQAVLPLAAEGADAVAEQALDEWWQAGLVLGQERDDADAVGVIGVERDGHRDGHAAARLAVGPRVSPSALNNPLPRRPGPAVKQLTKKNWKPATSALR